MGRSLPVLLAFLALALAPGSASAAPKKVAFKFSATSYSVAENAGTFNVTVQRSGNTTAPASVQVSDNGSGTATGGGVHYSLTGGTLNFAAGQTVKTFPVTIVDNQTANAPNKSVVLRLSNATPSGSQIKTTLTTLSIIDNEGPGTVDFSSSSYSVLEGAERATITVNRAGATNLTVSVDYATQAAVTDPATQVTDYAPVSPARTLTFNPGEMSKTFQVAIVDDSLGEGPENVGLVLTNPKNLTAGGPPQIGPNAPAQLTINDDDVSTFAFSAPAYFVQEDDAAGFATITVKRSGATNLPASVAYSTSDGTATSSDYAAATGTLAFAAGETTKTFKVAVINDGVAEANETVILTLTSGTSVETSLLSIVDNDDPKASVQLSSPTYLVNEADGTAAVVVTLSHAVDGDVTVDYATANGTAAAGSDYVDTHGTLTFTGNLSNGGPGTGQTSKTIQIPITQDADPEDLEDLTVTLSNALPGASSVLGAPATGTVTIADDDPPGTLGFKSLRYDVDESAGTATVTVERLGGVGGAVSVDYNTSDGSATAGSDYAPTSGTLHWAAGDGADKTFTIPVTWDGRAEAAESIGLALTNPGGGADLGTNADAIVRIADDGASGPLALSATAYRVGESGGAVTLTVKRSGGLGGPVTVRYATGNGTAAAGSDYVATSGTLVFAPGQAVKTFTVPVRRDSVDEADETFRVTISSAGGGASLGSPLVATVTIADDDAPPAGNPVNPDTTAPTLRVTAKKVQRALKYKRLRLSARGNEQVRLVVVAKVRVGKKRVVLVRAKRSASGDTTARIKLKLSRKAQVKLRRAMKSGKARVVLTVRATDAAGNRTAASRKVTVKR